jgi:hypothetical protein
MLDGYKAIYTLTQSVAWPSESNVLDRQSLPSDLLYHSIDSCYLDILFVEQHHTLVVFCLCGARLGLYSQAAESHQRCVVR